MESEPITTPTQIDLDRISAHLSLSQDTIKLVQDLITQYKQKCGPMHSIKLPYSIICAVLTAWKCQTISAIEEEQDLGQNLSVMDLIKCLNTITNDTFDLELFITELKQFINTVPLPHEIISKLKAIVNKFAFSYTFFVKYHTLFTKLDAQNALSEHGGYVAALKNFGWLLYINAKGEILKNEMDVVKGVFLLMSTLIHVVYNTPGHVTISYFEKLGKNIYDTDFQKKNQKAVQEAIIELLPIMKETKDELTTFNQKLESFIQKANEQNILHFDAQVGSEALYDAKNLYHNLDKLENHYQETLLPDDLDERFYLYNCRNTASKPGNFTPFAKQGSSNKITTHPGNHLTTPPSLNSQMQRPYLDIGVSGKMNLDLNLKDIKHSNQTVPASPYGQNLPSATPMTKALEMYNWLNDKVKLKKSESGFPLGLDRCLSIFGRDSKDDILVRLENILGAERAETSPNSTADLCKHLKDKHSQIVNLYFTILEVVLSKEERKGNTQQITDILKNDNFHRALVAASMETVFFVNNYSSISFVDLLELCGIQAFEFWRIISSFLNFDPKMPQPIKKHFHDLEFQIIMHLAWKKNSVVHQLINKFMDQIKNDSREENNIEESENIDTTNIPQNKPKPVILTHPQELFFKRLLHHIANQISQICDLLGLEDVMSEHVWTAMKHVIGSEGHLLINRHLNQFILCCVYGVTKVFQHPLKFQEIINKYQDLPRFNKDDFADVVHHVYMDDNSEADLIKFYNSVFITPMKSFLFSLSRNRAQAESRASNTPLIKSLNTPAVMQSPLRDFITNQKGMTPSQKIGLTPQTKALHAFGESPYGVLESINKILGKRPIDFIDSPKVVLSDVGNVLRKYVKHTDAVLDKMFEEDSTKSNTTTNSNIIESVTIDSEKCKPALPSKRNLFGTNPNKAAAK